MHTATHFKMSELKGILKDIYKILANWDISENNIKNTVSLTFHQCIIVNMDLF